MGKIQDALLGAGLFTWFCNLVRQGQALMNQRAAQEAQNQANKELVDTLNKFSEVCKSVNNKCENKLQELEQRFSNGEINKSVYTRTKNKLTKQLEFESKRDELYRRFNNCEINKNVYTRGFNKLWKEYNEK